MGVALHLWVADDSITTPGPSRYFYHQIIDSHWLELESFLSKEEIEILQPNSFGEVVLGEKKKVGIRGWIRFFSKAVKVIRGKAGISSMDDLFAEYLFISDKIEDRERDPQKLKMVFEKVEYYLKENEEKLPVVHYLYSTKEDLENNRERIEYIEIDGESAFVEGDLCHEDDYFDQYRNKIKIYADPPFLVEAVPKVTIAGEEYFVKTLGKADVFRDEFEEIYSFLNHAIKQGKKVLWEYDN